jgi:hypothetical protein
MHSLCASHSPDCYICYDSANITAATRNPGEPHLLAMVAVGSWVLKDHEQHTIQNGKKKFKRTNLPQICNLTSATDLCKSLNSNGLNDNNLKAEI